MKRLGFPVYFNHVPKCAGTSLNELLSRGLRRDQLGVEPFMPAMDLFTLPAAKLDRLALIASHYPHWAAARRLSEWTRLTVLREPWSRFQALLRHLVRVEHTEPQTVMTAVDVLRELRERRYERALDAAADWYPLNASIASYFLPDPVEGTTFPADAAKLAIDSLQAYDLVLLTDRLDEDTLLLDNVLNGQSFGATARLNTAKLNRDAAVGPFPDRYAEAFHRLFPYESEIYAAARALHPESHAALRRAHDAAASAAQPIATARPRLFALDWEAPTRCGGFSDRLVAQSVGYQGHVARRVEAGVGIVEFEMPSTAPQASRIEAVFWIAPFESRFDVAITLNGEPLSFFGAQKEVCPLVDNYQVWTWADVPRAVARGGRWRLEIDRRGARDLIELWLLDFVVRAR